MKKPWDDEPTPIVESWRNVAWQGWHGTPIDLARNLERRLRHTQMLLARCHESWDDPNKLVLPDIERYFTAAQKEDAQ